MKRRRLLITGASASALLACSAKQGPVPVQAPVVWRMATSWPPEVPGMSQAAKQLAETITTASGGRLRIDVYPGNEQVAPFRVFDAVAKGEVEMGHSAAYYWQRQMPAAPFFCSLPFGMGVDELNAWLLTGNGWTLWRELYAPHGVLPFPCGNTGVQTAAWSNREIASLDDLEGLKIRIPGLGGEVMSKLGAVPVPVPGADVFKALKAGTLDAAEWLAPMNDLALGLHKAAKYCYYPGWQEPGALFECLVNAKAMAALPADLQSLIEQCCLSVNLRVRASFDHGNARAMQELSKTFRVEFRRLPDSVTDALKAAANLVIDGLRARDPFAERVASDYFAFLKEIRRWRAISEVAYEQVRG